MTAERVTPHHALLGWVRGAWGHPVAGPALRIGLAYLVLVEVLVQLVFGRIDVPGLDLPWIEVGTRATPIPRDVFLVGAIVGVLYSLVGMGIILVYRANRIINFAQAQLGAVPAIAALLLMVRQGLPYAVAVPLALVGGAALGAGVEVGVVRRFQSASRLVLTVATVGVSLLLLVLEFVVKRAITGELLVVDEVPTPFSGLRLDVGEVTLRGDHFLTVAVAVAVLVALVTFFRTTRIGIAVRAAAENRDRAAMLGIPVNRVSLIVWALAGVLSAIGVFLRAPLVGLPLSGFVGPFFLLYGLAVAVIARMDRLPTALVAGMFIGVVDYAAVFATRRSSLATATMLVVILAALLVQRRHLARAQSGDAGSWDAVRELRPIPTELRRVPEVVVTRRLLLVLLGLGALLLPWLVSDVRVPFATTGLVYAMVGISLVILTGWAGQISLGQFALAGIGAAVAGGLSANHGWDLFAVLVLAGLAGAAAAMVIGLPAIRIQGLFLAVTTLAFAFTVQEFVLQPDFFGWLLPQGIGFVELPVLWGVVDLSTSSTLWGVTFTSATKQYLVGLALLAGAIGVASSLRRYRSGRILVGVRDNPRMLQAHGVNPVSTRLAAFAISGAIAGVAGGFFVFTQGAVDPGTYAPAVSIELFVITVLGGIGSIAGALLGAAFLQGFALTGVREIPVWGDVITLLGTSAGVLAILYVAPGGLAEALQRTRDVLLRRVAARRGIVVPSFIADVRQEAHVPDAAVVVERERDLELEEVPT